MTDSGGSVRRGARGIRGGIAEGEFAQWSVVNMPPVGKRSQSYRSRLTNGAKLHAKGVVDGRSAPARRLRDLVQAFAAPSAGSSGTPRSSARSSAAARP